MPRSPRYSRAHVSKREDLGVAQPRAERLAGLQVLVRHGAERRQAVLHREEHVAGADELRAAGSARRIDRVRARASVRITSSCQSCEKRRRVP